MTRLHRALFTARFMSVAGWLILCLGYQPIASAGQAYTFTTLFHCSTDFDSPYGINPWGAPVVDSAGNVYGTMFGGGPVDDGTVYRLDASNYYALTTLLSFNGTNGANPVAGLAIDPHGNLYGTSLASDGNVFMLNAAQNYAFQNLVTFNGTNGSRPFGGVTLDAAGNVYGTTQLGGPYGYDGTVFKLNAPNNFGLTTLALLTQSPGGFPANAPVVDRNGNVFFSTNLLPGIFELNAATNYSSSEITNGSGPGGPGPVLTFDSAGNLYGTSASGGANNDGTVFELDAAHGYALSILHSFYGTDGADPNVGLVIDANGDIFGTTESGGTSNMGTVFELNPHNNYAATDLVSFNGANGNDPRSGLATDANGDLFGVTTEGGGGFGTIYQLTPVPEPYTIPILLLTAFYALSFRPKALHG